MKKSQARELATRALHAATAEDWPAVKTAFADISADGSAITYALIAWCDTTLGAQAEMQGSSLPDSGPLGELVRPGWIVAETGRLTLDADEMPPPAQIGRASCRESVS